MNMTSGEPTTPQEIAESQIAQKVHSLISELDELMVLAASNETAALVEKEKIGIGQIVTRSQLIASFLMARQTPAGKLRLIQHV